MMSVTTSRVSKLYDVLYNLDETHRLLNGDDNDHDPFSVLDEILKENDAARNEYNERMDMFQIIVERMRHLTMSTINEYRKRNIHQHPSSLHAMLNAGYLRSDAIFMAARAGDTHTVVELIKAGIDVNTATEIGRTALMYASEGGHAHTVQELVGFGAFLDAHTSPPCELSAISFAAHARKFNVVNILISAGANVHVTFLGRSLLFLAAEENASDTIRMLLAAGAGGTESIDYIDPCSGRTALIAAARAGHVDAVCELIAGGARVDVNAMTAARESGNEFLLHVVSESIHKKY